MGEFIISDAFTFLNIVEEGSFASAAKKCCVSPSVISKRISRLEHQLGVQLLNRTTRRVTLTEIGSVFFEKCKRIRADMLDLHADVSQSHNQASGLLRINAPMSFGQLHLMPALIDFMRLQPEIRIELILGSQYANFIHNGLDLAIFIKDLPHTHLLKSRKIALRSTGLYASPLYFNQHPIPLIPEDLVNHNCLTYQSEPGQSLGFGQSHEWVFYREGHKIRVPVSGNLKVNSSQALVSAALSGLGIVKLSSFMVTEPLKKGSLISVLDEYAARDIDIHAAYPNQRYLPLKVKRLIDFLVTRFESQEYWD